MPTVRSTDLDLYYEVHGAGPRLLFCNGSGGTIDMVRPLIEVLARQFEVAVHDQRGLGRTGSPTHDEPFTLAQYASDVAQLLDHLSWPTVRLVGVSFGGMVAQEFAVTWPQRVERLALLCTSAGGEGGSSYPLHELLSLTDAERDERTPLLSDTRFTPEYLCEHPRDAALVAEARARAHRARSADEREGERRQLAARRGHDVWDRLGAVDCPTLIAAGKYDGIAPVANSEALASRLSHSSLRLYEGGHGFVLQDRTALPELLSFLLD